MGIVEIVEIYEVKRAGCHGYNDLEPKPEMRIHQALKVGDTYAINITSTGDDIKYKCIEKLKDGSLASRGDYNYNTYFDDLDKANKRLSDITIEWALEVRKSIVDKEKEIKDAKKAINGVLKGLGV